jgi:hypothetical protein
MTTGALDAVIVRHALSLLVKRRVSTLNEPGWEAIVRSAPEPPSERARAFGRGRPVDDVYARRRGGKDFPRPGLVSAAFPWRLV